MICLYGFHNTWETESIFGQVPLVYRLEDACETLSWCVVTYSVLNV